jgi:8-oxo-dGTP pyrophosphatase MutT (NUDIX family)
VTPPSSAATYHPRPDDHGKPVKIRHPTAPSPSETWNDANTVAVFVPDGPVPPALNDVPVAPARAPSGAAGWAKLVDERRGAALAPPMPKSSKTVAAGAVIVEPDGRVWLFEPTNHFAGYHRTFPKGTLEHGCSLEATAAREVFEETGLLIRIGRFFVDREGDLSIIRFFLARRIGGTPSAMGWEAQALWLVPAAQIHKYAPHANDAPVVRAVLEAVRGGG